MKRVITATALGFAAAGLTACGPTTHVVHHYPTNYRSGPVIVHHQPVVHVYHPPVVVHHYCGTRVC